MPHIKVSKRFGYCPKGQIYPDWYDPSPTAVEVDDRCASIAVAEGWAEEVKPKAAKADKTKAKKTDEPKADESEAAKADETGPQDGADKPSQSSEPDQAPAESKRK